MNEKGDQTPTPPVETLRAALEVELAFVEAATSGMTEVVVLVTADSGNGCASSQLTASGYQLTRRGDPAFASCSITHGYGVLWNRKFFKDAASRTESDREAIRTWRGYISGEIPTPE